MAARTELGQVLAGQVKGHLSLKNFKPRSLGRSQRLVSYDNVLL